MAKLTSSTDLIDMVEDAEVYKEQKKLKFNVECWSHNLVQKIVDILEENNMQD